MWYTTSNDGSLGITGAREGSNTTGSPASCIEIRQQDLFAIYDMHTLSSHSEVEQELIVCCLAEGSLVNVGPSV